MVSIKDEIYDIFAKNPTRNTRAYGYLQKMFLFTDKDRLLFNAIDFTKRHIPNGDFLEFGTFRGEITIKAYHWAKNSSFIKKMGFYVFDSFQGLPEPSKEEKMQFEKGGFACSIDDYKKILKRHSVDLNDVKLIKGFYEDSLTKDLQKKLKLKAQVVYVDCDLYESTVPVLNFITPYIQDGTVIIFDDWYCLKGKPTLNGEQIAFREWLKRNKQFTAVEFQKIGGLMNSFVIYKK